MAQDMEAQIKVGPQGRVAIPATIRKELGLEAGDTLGVRLQGHQLILEKREHILARLKTRFADAPRDVSLVDELIAERRADARMESER